MNEQPIVAHYSVFTLNVWDNLVCTGDRSYLVKVSSLYFKAKTTDHLSIIIQFIQPWMDKH